MKKILALFLAVVMLFSAVGVTAFAGGSISDDRDAFLAGLADPTVEKTTRNYNGFTWVVGSTSTWDCKLYTLSAEVTKMSGKIATVKITFNSKIASGAINVNSYNIRAVSNYPDGFDTADGKPGTPFFIQVDTSQKDPLGTSAYAGGIQFLKIRVEKTANEEGMFPLYSSNKYFSDIVKNREVYPENAGYITSAEIYDVYGFSYYIKPTFKLATNSFVVSKNAIYLGIYAFDGIVKYRVAGTNAWKQKAIVKNQKLYLTGLKANTMYVIQVLCKLPYENIETGKNEYALDLVGSQFTLTTALTSKPLLKQVKIYGVKYGKYTRKGYWETRSTGGYVWHPAETFYTASYKVRVTLRNVPARAKGLYLKAGGYSAYQAGRKGTYTFSMTYQAKKPVKGKKLACNLYYSSNTIAKKAVGIGPARGITYKLKNSTTNYKK